VSRNSVRLGAKGKGTRGIAITKEKKNKKPQREKRSKRLGRLKKNRQRKGGRFQRVKSEKEKKAGGKKTIGRTPKAKKKPDIRISKRKKKTNHLIG